MTAAHTDIDIRMAHEVVGGGRLKLLAPNGQPNRDLTGQTQKLLRAATWRVPVSVLAHHQAALAEALTGECRRHDAVVLVDNAVAIYWKALESARCRVADIHNVAGWSLAAVECVRGNAAGSAA